MNKKLLAFIVITTITVCLVVVFILVPMGNSKGNVIDAGKNFKVYDVTKNNQPEYRYEIYNNTGVTVKNETVWKSYPNIAYINDNNLLSIYIGVGAGTFLVQYYDIEKDLFSKTFESPAIAEYGKIVYMVLLDDQIKLAVSDIFDSAEYYKEFELDFSPVANPIDALKEVKFVDEFNLQVLYLSGNDYEEKTVNLTLG